MIELNNTKKEMGKVGLYLDADVVRQLKTIAVHNGVSINKAAAAVLVAGLDALENEQRGRRRGGSRK